MLFSLLTSRHIPSPLSCLSFLLLPLYESEVLLGTVNVRYSLFADGYEHKTAGKLKYWINKTSSSKARLPIFFFHGIGGVFSYLKLLSGLNIFGCPIVIVEMPYVSLHVAPHVPTIDEHVTAVEQILDENGFEGAIIVGHSFGTTVMSWLVQSMPNRIAGAVFLDPVVFMLHLRDISFNWMYGSCNNVGHEVSNLGVEDIFGIVKTELFAANAVQRHFYWSRNILWAHDLQDKQVESIVLLSGSDRVVPSLEVARHIQEHNLDLERSGQQSCIDSEIFETAGHGSLVFEEEFRAKALKSIGVIIEKSHANWRGFSKGAIASPVADTLMTSADTAADHPLITVSLASRDSIETFSSPIDKK
jgi:pimeloyl-ACP methyl ester carboxylesterase